MLELFWCAYQIHRNMRSIRSNKTIRSTFPNEEPFHSFEQHCSRENVAENSEHIIFDCCALGRERLDQHGNIVVTLSKLWSTNCKQGLNYLKILNYTINLKCFAQFSFFRKGNNKAFIIWSCFKPLTESCQSCLNCFDIVMFLLF